jgi:hypothetical protein
VNTDDIAAFSNNFSNVIALKVGVQVEEEERDQLHQPWGWWEYVPRGANNSLWEVTAVNSTS